VSQAFEPSTTTGTLPLPCASLLGNFKLLLWMRALQRQAARSRQLARQHKRGSHQLLRQRWQKSRALQAGSWCRSLHPPLQQCREQLARARASRQRPLISQYCRGRRATAALPPVRAAVANQQGRVAQAQRRCRGRPPWDNRSSRSPRYHPAARRIHRGCPGPPLAAPRAGSPRLLLRPASSRKC
jgi:hypothetical protein